MTTALNNFHFELVDENGRALTGLSGFYIVTKRGDPELETIYDTSGNVIALSTSPAQAFTNGIIDFGTLATVDSVDVFVYDTTYGYFRLEKDARTGSKVIVMNIQNRQPVLVFPFHPSNYTAATAKDLLVTEVAGVVYDVSRAGIKVTVVDATETIDFGTQGDADGYLAALSVATAGTVLQATTSLAAYGTTAGERVGVAGQKFQYTLSTGSDTAEGYIFLPSIIPVVI